MLRTIAFQTTAIGYSGGKGVRIRQDGATEMDKWLQEQQQAGKQIEVVSITQSSAGMQHSALVTLTLVYRDNSPQPL